MNYTSQERSESKWVLRLAITHFEAGSVLL
jgi:hypothetical protein